MNKVENRTTENREEVLCLDHENIDSRIIVGPSVGKSRVKLEEPEETLRSVLKNTTLIFTGPSRIGKTSLGNLTTSLYKKRSKNIFHFNCERLSLDDCGEENVLDSAETNGITVKNTKELLDVLKINNYLVFIDELTLLINPNTERSSAPFFKQFIFSLQETSIPHLLVIHESPKIWQEIEKNWSFLLQAPKKIPRLFTPQEICFTARHGNLYDKEEALFEPKLYKGMSEKTADEFIKIFGRWPVVVNQVLQDFSKKQSSSYHPRPAEELDTDILYEVTHKYLWYDLLTSNQMYSLPKEILRNLKEAGKLQEFINAFQLPRSYPDRPPEFEKNAKPLSAKKTSLSSETLQLLKNMQVVYEETNNVVVDGLLFSYLINNQVDKI